MNHQLLIEKARYLDIEHGCRLCSLCPYQVIGDEFHYLFEYTSRILDVLFSILVILLINEQL